jgi:spermidine synthase
MQIFHADGRVFLNQNKKIYDVIFGDAFTSWYSVPYQLATREAVQKKYESLSESGVVILNIISSIE